MVRPSGLFRFPSTEDKKDGYRKKGKSGPRAVRSLAIMKTEKIKRMNEKKMWTEGKVVKNVDRREIRQKRK